MVMPFNVMVRQRNCDKRRGTRLAERMRACSSTRLCENDLPRFPPGTWQIAPPSCGRGTLRALPWPARREPACGRCRASCNLGCHASFLTSSTSGTCARAHTWHAGMSAPLAAGERALRGRGAGKWPALSSLRTTSTVARTEECSLTHPMSGRRYRQALRKRRGFCRLA